MRKVSCVMDGATPLDAIHCLGRSSGIDEYRVRVENGRYHISFDTIFFDATNNAELMDEMKFRLARSEYADHLLHAEFV